MIIISPIIIERLLFHRMNNNNLIFFLHAYTYYLTITGGDAHNDVLAAGGGEGGAHVVGEAVVVGDGVRRDEVGTRQLVQVNLREESDFNLFRLYWRK